MPDIRARLAAALSGRYAVDRELGAGGMATVYLARDLKHGRAVAIKVVRPEIAAALGAERFLREIAISAHLQHPNILTLIDSGEADGLLYCVMPFVEGETLRARLAREGTLSPPDAARILRDVLDGLAYAHQQGIVHRDIKPDNIMLSGRHAFVMDFGVAKAASAAAESAGTPHATLTTLGIAIGTPAYMAPEQAAGDREIDGRADIYAVGALGYELLTGKPPFSGSTAQAILAAHVTRTPEPLSSALPSLAEGFASALMRCLEKQPVQRWQTAEELLERIEEYSTPGTGTAATTAALSVQQRQTRRVGWAVGALAIVVVGVWLWLGPGRTARESRWAREKGIPQLLALGEAGQWTEAYWLARRVEAAIPHDSVFNALRPRFARRMSLRTSPSGAKVWWRPYDAADSAWALLGTTPLDSVLLPNSASNFINDTRLKIDAPGYRTLDLIWFPFGDSLTLAREADVPPEMVAVKGGSLDLALSPGYTHAPVLELRDFLMDRFEVTNADFKRFVDSGGYRRPELWEYPFVKDGQSLTREQAMRLLTDQTGRPGPATWVAGDYPADQASYPVAGVSWYEAAAYARFAGKSLPTVYHWYQAASVRFSASMIPFSNFSGQGPSAAGSHRATSAFGVYDLAGNVREWCLNQVGEQRYILGGGWNDQPYQFVDPYSQPVFDRSPTNGIRLVRYDAADPNIAAAGAPLHRSDRDFAKEKPVSDEVFAVYRRMYEYDRTPLNPKVEESVDEGDWTRDLVSLDAAYFGDRLLLYAYLPKRGTKPYPSVVYFPGSSAIRDRAPQNLQWRSFEFILRSGRAVLYPIYKGTYQRSDSLDTDVQNTSTFYRDHVIMWAKDMRRSIDYLETRPDLTVERLAYFGLSWGGAMGGLMPAVEPRIRSSVLYVAGLDLERARPEVDPINFLPRVRIPTLMLNGRYDFFFPIETAQLPMFHWLGTPADQKRHVIEEGSHYVPRVRLIGETLDWLDRYQPVAH